MTKKLGMAVILVVLLGAAGGAAIAASQRYGRDSAGGPPAQPDAQQGVSAQDAGIKVSIDRANFSGTATIVELRIEPAQASAEATNPAVRFQVDPTSFAPASLGPSPGMGGFTAAPGRPLLVRLQPVAPGKHSVVALTSVMVSRKDGARTTVSGTWQLPLVQPADIVQRMRVEHLDGVPASDAGIRVTLQGGARSFTETLVTVYMDSQAAVSQIGEPFILAGAARLSGGLLSSQEGGRLLTYAFPPTEFGQPLDLHFGPFAAAGTATDSTIEVDVGSIIRRNNLRGDKATESAGLQSGDVRQKGGAEMTLRGLQLSNGFNSTRFPGKHTTVEFSVDGNYPPEQSSFKAVTDRGQELVQVFTGYGYSKDATGAIGSPRTDIRFLYEGLGELSGQVTLSRSGSPQDTIRGEWRLTLRPAP